ncbi:PH domain-containing protein [Fluviispira vulneris]|uniref:PH domain-containing protein n=1 Tax=Fluviispira vulneris TaxID=2763012 RepID=UPI0016477F2B|nr:PH domain-containing protein [Fluviispira vulneris]
MALNLRENEKLKLKAKIHWLSYTFQILFGVLFTLYGLTTLASKDSHLLLSLIIGLLPLLYKMLVNYCKEYSLTNQRLYIEDGILAKTKREIPVQKINDFEINQGIIQRIFGAGNVHVLTGNDKPTILRNIKNPDDFKNNMSEITGVISQKAINPV